MEQKDRISKASSRIKNLHPWIHLAERDIDALQQTEDRDREDCSGRDSGWNIFFILLAYAGVIALLLYGVLNLIVGEWHGPD